MDEELFYEKEFTSLCKIFNEDKDSFLEKIELILTNPLNNNNYKNKNSKIQEIKQFLNNQSVENSNGKNLLINDSINKACQRQIELIINNYEKSGELKDFDKYFHNNPSTKEKNIQDSLNKYYNINTNKLIDFYQIQEKGKSLENIIAKLLNAFDISRIKPKKINYKDNNKYDILSIITSGNFNTYGVGLKKYYSNTNNNEYELIFNIIFLNEEASKLAQCKDNDDSTAIADETKFENKNTSNLNNVSIENINEINFNKIDKLVIDYINQIRSFPIENISEFSVLLSSKLREFSINKFHFDEAKIKSLMSILKNNKQLPKLERRINLDELAKKLLLNKSTTQSFFNSINSQQNMDLSNVIKAYVAESENLSLEICGVQIEKEDINLNDIFNEFDALSQILFTKGNELDFINKFFVDDQIKSLGLAFELSEDIINFLFIFAKVENSKYAVSRDIYSNKSYSEANSDQNNNSYNRETSSESWEVQLKDLFKEELKRLRKNPRDFIPEIQQMKKTYTNINRYSGLKDNIDDILVFLNQATPLPEIELDTQLSLACNEYIDFLIDTKNCFNYYAEEDDLLRLRLQHYVYGFKNTCQYVIYQRKNISEIILNLLLEENIRQNKKGLVFFGKNFKYYGIAEKKVRGKMLLVLIFTDYIQKFTSVVERIKESFLKDLAFLRKYPRAFIKFLYGFRSNEKSTNNNYNAAYNPFKLETEKSDIDKLADFLFARRSLPTLEDKQELNFLAEKFVFDLINNKTLLQQNEGVNDSNTNNNYVSKNYNSISNKSNSNARAEKLISLINEISINSLSNFEEKIQSFNQKNTAEIRSLFKYSSEAPVNLFCIGIDNFTSSTEALNHILKNPSFRNAIFNQQNKYIGIIINEQRKILFIIICDEFKSQTPLVDYKLQDIPRLIRPQLTKDEEDEIKKDFQRLDTLNKGFINPLFLVNIMQKNNLKDKNIIYYTSLQLFLSDNHKKPKDRMSLDVFLEYIKKTYSFISMEEHMLFYNILTENRKQKELKFEEFKLALVNQNFTFLDSEAESIFYNLCYPDETLSLKKYLETMDVINKMKTFKNDN